jgi:hypothetical protein
VNEQHGPEDALEALRSVVSGVAYKPGWRVWVEYKKRESEHLTGSEGVTLCISATDVPDSTKPGATTYIEHWMAVPPASWGRLTWERWVLDQLILVETHEAMEFYAVSGEKPYFPAHGPGRDPYAIERKDVE